MSTGSVTLRSLFDNADSTLVPGMFVRARIVDPSAQGVLLIPQKAVSIGPDGAKTVWVVDKDNSVMQQNISTSGTHSNQFIVESGVSEGDRVVVDGTMKLGPGMKVKSQQAQSDKS